jgi:hypothetical protein
MGTSAVAEHCPEHASDHEVVLQDLAEPRMTKRMSEQPPPTEEEHLDRRPYVTGLKVAVPAPDELLAPCVIALIPPTCAEMAHVEVDDVRASAGS